MIPMALRDRLVPSMGWVCLTLKRLCTPKNALAYHPRFTQHPATPLKDMKFT